jgi:MbtH protein
MTNPFDDENGRYLVLVNDERQHSMWPAHVPVPTGWTSVHGEAARQECLDYIERAWTDLRPAGLVDGRAGGPA